ANLAPGNPIVLDQLDDGATDTGGIYVCTPGGTCTGQGSSGAEAPGRQQQAIHRVVSVNGNQVTIEPPLANPNWRASQNPNAWWTSSPIRNAGIEALTLDHGSNQVGNGTMFMNAVNCWMKGVRSLSSWRNQVLLLLSVGTEIRDSYFYGSVNTGSTSYGLE